MPRPLIPREPHDRPLPALGDGAIRPTHEKLRLTPRGLAVSWLMVGAFVVSSCYRVEIDLTDLMGKAPGGMTAASGGGIPNGAAGSGGAGGDDSNRGGGAPGSDAGGEGGVRAGAAGGDAGGEGGVRTGAAGSDAGSEGGVRTGAAGSDAGGEGGASAGAGGQGGATVEPPCIDELPPDEEVCRLLGPPTREECSEQAEDGWKGCYFGNCLVCSKSVVDYPYYFDWHPCCQVNTTCASSEPTRCNSLCPAPTEREKSPPCFQVALTP